METGNQIGTFVVEYSSNNSGGYWWLKDEQWDALAAAGWRLKPVNKDYLYDDGEYVYGDDGIPLLSDKPPRFDFSKDGRWLGARFKEGHKVFDTVKEAIEEFERLTGQSATDEGCSCCGAPHNFYWWPQRQTAGKRGKDAKHDYNFASGDEIASILYPGVDISGNKRDIASRLSAANQTL